MPDRPRKTLLMLLAVLLLAPQVACRDDAPEELPEPVEEPAVEEPAPDTAPPRFAGLDEVAPAGEGQWALRWRAGEDDRTPREALVYEVIHVAEPWRPIEEGDVVHTTPPGAVRATVDLDGPAGRFAVRAVDEAGNRSTVREVLRAPPPIGLVHAFSGTPATSVLACEPMDSGRALCVLADGGVLIWDRAQWRSTPLRGVERMRTTRAADDLVLWSPRGDLARLRADGSIEELRAEFSGRAPVLPLRQVTGDSLGLVTALDAEGHAWIGAVPHLRHAARPLLLPRTQRCRRLWGIVQARNEGAAFCDDGSAHSIVWDRARPRWQPLIPDVPEQAALDARSAVALGGGRLLVFGDRQVWLLGSGEGEALAELHALDDEAGIGGRLRRGDDWFVASARGLLRLRDDRLLPVPGASGPVAGVIAPTALEPDDQLTLLYRDGAVGALRRARVEWKVAPPLGALSALGTTADGSLLALAERPDPGVWRADPDGWRRLAAAPPLDDDATIDAIALLGARAVLAGQRAGEGRWWIRDGRTWRTPTLLVHPALLPTEEPPPSAPDNEEPPHPATLPLASDAGIPLDRAPGPRTVEPLLGLATSAEDDRLLAWSHGQVWASADAVTWTLWAEDIGPILHVAPDGGEAWIAFTAQGLRRCVRHLCEQVPAPEGAPRQVRNAWTGPDGRTLVLTADGLLRHTPAPAPIDPVAPAEQPAGTLEPVLERVGANVTRRTCCGAEELALHEDGSLWLVRAEQPDLLLRRAGTVLGLHQVDGAPVVVSPDGVFHVRMPDATRRGTEGGDTR